MDAAISLMQLNKANRWHSFVAKKSDHVLLFELHECIPIFDLFYSLLVRTKLALLSLGNEVVQQVLVLDTSLSHFVAKVAPIDCLIEHGSRGAVSDGGYP